MWANLRHKATYRWSIRQNSGPTIGLIPRVRRASRIRRHGSRRLVVRAARISRRQLHFPTPKSSHFKEYQLKSLSPAPADLKPLVDSCLFAEMQNLSKLDVARRQLVTAIRLLFDDRDPVSIYTLATNSQEILSQLCERRGMRSLRSSIARAAGASDLQVQRKLINPSRNFFKHADK